MILYLAIIVNLCGGIFIVQDALASIAFYPDEKWRWNHTARLIRAVIGLAMVVIGGMLLWVVLNG